MKEQEEMGLQKRESNAMADASAGREIQEVQAMMVIAKRFPRDEKAALDKILNACTRPGLADAACYQYSRGGTDITGPSIRLAEAIAQNWGNIQFGVRELEQRGDESTVEAFAWDMETNTRQVKVFQVKHIRGTKAGNKALTDPRDIYELVANNGARRVRACILGVIPGDVVDEAVKACETTLTAKVEITPERIKGLVESFAQFGVTKAHIEKRIQRHVDAITAGQILSLRKIFNSLKDGMSKASDWFEVESAASCKGKSPLEQAAVKLLPGESVDISNPLKTDKELVESVVRKMNDQEPQAAQDEPEEELPYK